jgi:hypothetical protein
METPLEGLPTLTILKEVSGVTGDYHKRIVGAEEGGGGRVQSVPNGSHKLQGLTDKAEGVLCVYNGISTKPCSLSSSIDGNVSRLAGSQKHL